MIKSIFLCSVLLLVFSVNTMAHTIRFEVEKHSPTVTVHAYFSRTSPLVDASVEVFSPGNEEAFQKGRTDKHGFFAFRPDENGNWKVTVDDGMGHFDKITVNVSDKFFIDEELIKDEEPAKAEETKVVNEDKPEQVKQAEIPLIYRIIFGLSLIFGITGIMYGIKAKQSLKK